MAKPWEKDEIVSVSPWENDEVVANPTNTKPEVGFGGLVLPSVQKFNESNAPGFALGRYGALAKDVLSLPRRAFGAGAELLKGNTEAAKGEMARTEGRNVVENIGREAPLFFMPGYAAAQAPTMVGKVAAAAGAGLVEAAPVAALHQLERLGDGQKLSLPQFAGEVATGGVFRGGATAVAQTIKKAIPFVKRGVSAMTEVPMAAIEDATDPTKLRRFQEAAQRFADDGKTDLSSMADDLGAKVQKENALRDVEFAAQKTKQANEMEGSLLTLRPEATPSGIKSISAADRGELLVNEVAKAKPPLQLRFIENDQKALGNLRQAPAAELKFVNGDGTPAAVKSVVPGIADVLTEFKALRPEQGVPKITKGAAGAIRGIMNLAQERVQSIDDLINLKTQLRSVWDSGAFEGGLYDKTVDDVAFARTMKVIEGAEDESIRAAAGPSAKKIIDLVDKNRALYAKTKEMLSNLDQRFSQVQNSERIIPKIKEMGPDAIRMVSEARQNKVLKPVVEELRRGFIDDLLLSAQKDGQFSPKTFAKEWSNISDDIKAAWLSKNQILDVERAVKAGTTEIAEPDKVGKAIFGNDFDKFSAASRLENIGAEAKAKAMAELKTLDALFGSDYSKQAFDAFRAKQLRMNSKGEMGPFSAIRTGKANAFGGGGAGLGGTIGASVAGAPGAALGFVAGGAAGFYAQSPAGAALIFRALNRLQKPSTVAPAAVRAASQATRTGIGQDTQEEW